MSIVDNYDGFIFDLDGTIYLDDKIIPNVDKVVNKLKAINKKIVFVSNKTTGSIADYHKLLNSNGLKVSKEQILSSTIIIKKYLSKNFNKKKYYAIAEKKFIKEINSGGNIFCDDPEKIDIVIVTLDRTLNYSKLEIAANALDNGAKFFAANIDSTCPVEAGEILDAGSTISALEKRTKVKLQKHFGKPSKYMFEETMELLKLPPEKCLIIGDRLETDIAMANKFGIDSALVLTGVSKDIKNFGKHKPTYIINSVFDLI
ncbi:MAG: HAD-IIA family hydrolase [Ignavibacteriae bacterium]|nr:HAD-IIA family hydrolase [Ignavibacteriota bacterium]MCB0748316.1 HAD-IIA family hydrolase [Ignavibacteriota bacterium]